MKKLISVFLLIALFCTAFAGSGYAWVLGNGKNRDNASGCE